MDIILHSLEFLESRFFRGNKGHDLHCLVHSTWLQIIFLNIPFPSKAPSSLTSRSCYCHNVPMQTSALRGSVSSTGSRAWGVSVSFPATQPPLPHLSNLAFPHPSLNSVLVGRTGNCYRAVDFALSKPKILWLLGTAFVGGREGIVNNKSFPVVNNYLKDHTCNLRNFELKNKSFLLIFS